MCAGGGAVEAALAMHLEQYATTLSSREQLAIAEFADALLVIPKTLAVNAAKVRQCTPTLGRAISGRHYLYCEHVLTSTLPFHILRRMQPTWWQSCVQHTARRKRTPANATSSSLGWTW